jgi:hypothetical protein
MSSFRNIGRLAALVGLTLTLSACHFYAPYYGPPRHHGYHDHDGHGHGGHRHHRHKPRPRPYHPY